MVRINLSKLQVEVLLDHVSRGAFHPQVGFVDADRTQAQLQKDLGHGRSIRLDAVESALWSCNLMNEQGQFQHPDGATFEQFVQDITPAGKIFDKFFNVFLDGWVK